MDKNIGTQIPRTSDVIARQQLTDDPPSEALLRAFVDLDVDLSETEERLVDLVDPDSIDELFDDDADDADVQLSAVLWDYPVLITTDAVHVFEPSARE